MHTYNTESLNTLECLANKHEKIIYVTQKIKRCLAQEECTQNEIEKIIENLAYEYVSNL